MDNYNVLIRCKNCGSSNWHNLQKGLTTKEYMESHECANCGCLLNGKSEKDDD